MISNLLHSKQEEQKGKSVQKGDVVLFSKEEKRQKRKKGEGKKGDGSITDPDGNPLAGSSIGNPYYFTGRRLDSETGLYYYRARYYDSELGRFLTQDPIGYLGGINLYTYCHNNPINYIDPYGTNDWEWFWLHLIARLADLTGATVGSAEEAVDMAEDLGGKIKEREKLIYDLSN